jgi:glycosyltransferase involved in cell wall biosynthesis
VLQPRSIVTRFFESLSRFILRKSDANVVLGRCMQDVVLKKGTPAPLVSLIPVWADLAGVEPVAHEANPYRAQWAPNGETIVMYSGNFGIGHDAATLCGAMELLRDEPNLRFVFVGAGKRRAEVEAFIKAKNITSASWHDYQPREKLGQSLSAGDVHIISIREGLEGIIVPSKLFGIMAVGRPSIFIGNETSEIARVLSETGSGVTIREGDPAPVAHAIRKLVRDPARRTEMGDRARQGIQGAYDRDTACEMWIRLIETGSSTSTQPTTPIAAAPLNHTTA